MPCRVYLTRGEWAGYLLGLAGLVDDGERGVVVVGFGRDAHAFGQQASPAARRMVRKVELARLQSGVALRDKLPAQVRELALEQVQDSFRACACADEGALGRILREAAVEQFGQLVGSDNRAEQGFPSVAVALGNGDAHLARAWVYR